MKTFKRSHVATFSLVAALCALQMTESAAVAQHRGLMQAQQSQVGSGVSASHFGHHQQPIQYKTFNLAIHPGQHEAVTVYLHQSTPYSITTQHNPSSIYPTHSGRHDVKLRVLRFWNGQLKMDRHATGFGSASMNLQSTHFGVRPYVIKVYNHSASPQRFLLTIRAQQVVHPLPRPIVQPLPSPIVRPLPRPGVGPVRPGVGKPPARPPVHQLLPIRIPHRDQSVGRVSGVIKRSPKRPQIQIPEIRIPGISIGI